MVTAQEDRQFPRLPVDSTAPTSGYISAVSLKLPPFWPGDPEVWFAQVEVQFITRRVTAQRTKFDHVIASLSPEVATEIRDLILKPPEADPYSVLKEQLIKRTAASEQRRLLNAEELGDRKPTQLLRRMQQLLGDRAGTTDGAFLRELFLQRLPANVRMVLASTASLEDMAELADKIVKVATLVVTAVDSPLPQLTVSWSNSVQRLAAFSPPSKLLPDKLVLAVLPVHTLALQALPHNTTILNLGCAGITKDLGMTHKNASQLAPEATS